MFYNDDKQSVFSPPSISASTVECYTPAQQIPQEYRVRMEIDEAIRDTSRHFTYREDPVVLKIHPAKSFLRWVKFSYRNKRKQQMNEEQLCCSAIYQKKLHFYLYLPCQLFLLWVQLQRANHFLSEVKEKGEGCLFSLCDFTSSCCWAYLWCPAEIPTAQLSVSPILCLDITLMAEENHLMWQLSRLRRANGF